MGLGAPCTPLPLSITSRLAPELYDLFLDEFHASKSTLSACSLVCRQWLPLCRHHLFFSVALQPDFVDFLKSSSHAHDTIAPHIRHVELGGGWMREKQHEFNDTMMFMITLKNVRKISLETLSWTYLEPAAESALLGGQGSVFHTVTTLHLTFIRFPSFSILTTFVSQFPRLRELAFDNITWDDMGPNQLDANPPFLFGLEKLSICACSNEPIISWLSAPDSADSIAVPIHSLHLPELLPHEATQVGKFLASLPASLENLELGFLGHIHDDAPAIRDVVGEIDLSLHTRLRTIRIHQLSLYQFPSPPATPPSSPPPPELSPCIWLIPFLSRISSPMLSTISFNIWLGGEQQLDLLDWNALVKVLENPAFAASLRSLQFSVRGIEPAMDDEVAGWISRRLGDWGGVQDCLEVCFE
ncbi:F-box domain-containing protein [Favolaschia claudopus]|uniref:F-box domain-containing protein n=1 Tax=Favolaschia claudopus TaxID=2862362 RepID=A0AAW0D6X7_9AGAR